MCLLVSDSFYDAMTIHLITPLIVLALLLVSFLIVALIILLKQMDVLECCCSRRFCVSNFNYDDTGAAWRRASSFFYGVLRLMVPGIVSRAVRVFSCKDVNGRLWMIADLREECHVSEQWISASIFSMCFIVLYVVIMPIVQVCMLRRRSNMHEGGKYFNVLYGVIPFKSTSKSVYTKKIK